MRKKEDALTMDILEPLTKEYPGLLETYVEETHEEIFLEYVRAYEEHNQKCLIQLE